jgi:putative endonuclease
VGNSQHCVLGQTGEDLACEELRRQGYAILARRYRTRGGEIDIVAREGDTLVFAEVKTRRSLRCGEPAEALTRGKRRQVAAMAADWLARHRVAARSCRFDVVTISFDGSRPAVRVMRGAFAADD